MSSFLGRCWHEKLIYCWLHAELIGLAARETFLSYTCQVNEKREERFYLSAFLSSFFELKTILVTIVGCPTVHSTWWLCDLGTSVTRVSWPCWTTIRSESCHACSVDEYSSSAGDHLSQPRYYDSQPSLACPCWKSKIARCLLANTCSMFGEGPWQWSTEWVSDIKSLLRLGNKLIKT